MPTRGKSAHRTRSADPAEFTPCFEWRGSQVHCEDVSLEPIARRVGTPAYVYSATGILTAYRRLGRAFSALPHSICYSVKANSNLSILRLLARAGSSFDIVSGGELYRLLTIGVSPRRIVFSGVGKTREELREALRAGILLFNVESEAELDLLETQAARLRRVASAGVRLNPDVAAGGHPHISTGRRSHKFGVDLEDARRLYRHVSPWIRWQGISAHIGSQILSVAPFRTAVERLARFAAELGRNGVALKYFDFGGGIGVRYSDESEFPLGEYARVLARTLRPLGCRLLLEPGRVIVGPAGVLLTRVLLTKRTRGKSFVVVDAAMNDFLRPALYHAVHPITPARKGLAGAGRGAPATADIVGPICETGDAFLHDWPIGNVQAGDLLVVWGTGAYGSVGASNYNSRPRPAEVLVEGSRFRVIRRRESRADLLRGE